MMTGYLNNRKKPPKPNGMTPRQAFHPHRDVGRFDSEGFLTLMDPPKGGKKKKKTPPI